MYTIKLVLKSSASPKACSASEFDKVVAANVSPVRKSPTTKGMAHFIILKMRKAVIKLTIPRMGMWAGAAKLSIAK